MVTSTSIIKKAIANSFFLHHNVSRVCFSSSPTYSEGYHASDEHKRKPDYDKGFNDDLTIEEAGDRILEMTEKTKRSMEESMARTAKKIDESKKKSETTISNSMKEKTSELAHETIDEVKKTKQKMKNVWDKAKEETHKIKENVVGKLWDDDKKSVEDYIEDRSGRKKKENDDKKH